MIARALCLVLLLGSGRLVAQGEKEPPPAVPVITKGTELTWDVDPVVVELDYKARVLYLIGDVRVTVDDLVIRCDNLVAWLQKEGEKERRPKPATEETPELVPGLEKSLDPARKLVRQIYVEGHVIMRRGEEVTRAERAFLDLRSGRGLVVNSSTRTKFPGPQETSPLVIRAGELRLLSRNQWQASGVELTTSPFNPPSTHLSVGELDVIKDPPGYVMIGGEPTLVQNYSFEARDNVFHIGRTPVLPLPDFSGDTARGGIFRYVEDVRYGRSNRFGQEPGITIGDDIRVGENDEVWGHWSVPIDWFSKRGWGVGARIDYQTEDYRGWVIGRYQRDRGSDRFFGDPPTRNRGLLIWNHRHFLPWGVQLDLEGTLFSDRGYYPTFFERLDKTTKPPENLVFLKKAWLNQQVSLLTSYRFNDWLTTTESLPELRYDLVSEPLFDLGSTNLLLNTTARVGKLRRKTEEDFGIQDRDTFRVDLDTLFEVPLLVGPLKLTPFAGFRYTKYDRDLAGRSRDRFGLTYGATLTMQAWRTFDAEGGIFGLDGLRHVILPEVTFRQTTGVEVGAEELVFFDEVETFDDVQVIEFSLRNLFQTVRHRRDGPAVSSIFEIELEMDFFPNARRDNGGDPFGNLEADLVVRFSDALQVTADFEVDWYGDGLEIWNVASGYVPDEGLQVYAGFRHFRDTYDAVFFQLNWRVEEKWLVNLDTSYDFEEDRGIEHTLTLARFGPDWVFEISGRADLGDNDFSIRVDFSPRALYRSFLRPRSLREEPRLGFIGRGLGR